MGNHNQISTIVFLIISHVVDIIAYFALTITHTGWPKLTSAQLSFDYPQLLRLRYVINPKIKYKVLFQIKILPQLLLRLLL